jgi:hypothetical protein
MKSKTVQVDVKNVYPKKDIKPNVGSYKSLGVFWHWAGSRSSQRTLQIPLLTLLQVGSSI